MTEETEKQWRATAEEKWATGQPEWPALTRFRAEHAEIADVSEKRCAKCGETKPVSEFYRNRSTRDGIHQECKTCWDARNEKWIKNNREKYLEMCREKGRRRRAADPEGIKRRKREDYRELKRELFDHYGWECTCCGSTENLTLDHIKGDGAEHRFALTGRPDGKNGGDQVFREIRRKGFPPGYQTLCAPCNNSKRGGPHCKLHHGDTRVDAALLMREAGWTYAAIADALGVSTSRAFQFCKGQWAHSTPSHSE